MDAETLSGRQKVLATAGVMLALLLASLDQTIVGTALPRIVADLKGLDYYAWVTTSYLVTSTIIVPIAGKLGDMFGRKPFMLLGVIGFIAASALCGLSQNMAQLVIFRGIQGLFGGFLFAVVFTVLADIFPPEQRARMQGLFGGVFGLSSVIGPTIGGWLTDGFGWRWVFYVNLPVGILAALVIFSALPRVRSKATWRDIDFAGSIALAAGLVPLLVALSITRDHAWTSPQVVGLLAVAAVMLVAFFFIERRSDHPVVPFQLFRNNVFAVMVIVAFITAFGMFGAIIFVPLIYQGVLGVSATNSGQLLTPMVFSLLIFSIISGQVMLRIRYYRFLGTVGVTLMILGLWMLSQVSVSTSEFRVALDLIVVGAGLGITFPLSFTAVQSALPREYLGVGTSQIQFWRNLGGTIGTAVLGSVLSRQLPAAISARIAALNLPPRARHFSVGGGSSSPQSLFDPARLAHLRAQLPVQFQPIFDSVIHATRLGLADALHDLFLTCAITLVIALVATLFLREVPLNRSAGVMVGEAPVPEGASTRAADAAAPA